MDCSKLNQFDYAIDVIGAEYGTELTLDMYELMLELAGDKDLDYMEIQEVYEEVLGLEVYK